MKQTTVEFSFDDAKLGALKMYLNDKNIKLADELERFVDALYKKHVPPAVREFIERKGSEGMNGPNSQRSSRKKPNIGCVAVSGLESDDGENARPADEKPV